MDELLGLLLLRESCILDEAFGGRVAHIHVVFLILIGLYEVRAHVDYNFSTLLVLGQFDVRLCASKCGDIVRCDLCNFV